MAKYERENIEKEALVDGTMAIKQKAAGKFISSFQCDPISPSDFE